MLFSDWMPYFSVKTHFSSGRSSWNSHFSLIPNKKWNSEIWLDNGFRRILWYSELFYYNPKDLVGRRGNEPIGHLTQLLWKSTNAIGCARTQKLIKQPPNYVPKYLRSGYTVCHYAPQGNIVGLQHQNWNDLDESICSTYDNYNGASQCGTTGTCQGMESGSKCGCQTRDTGVTVPLCSGKCLVECSNQWGTINYWPRTCIGNKYCTCGVKGAVCE